MRKKRSNREVLLDKEMLDNPVRQEPLPFDELPLKEKERLEYIQSWLSGHIISGIESAYLYFKRKDPAMRNANRLLRYENAYKYRLFELGY